MDTPNLVCLTINQNALFRLSIMRIRVFKYPVRPPPPRKLILSTAGLLKPCVAGGVVFVA